METVTPPTDISQINKLPFDIQRKLALNLDYEDIINLCRTNRNFSIYVKIHTFGEIK